MIEMNQRLEEDRQAILLLCAPLPGPAKPLTPSEYNLVVTWLVESGKRPGDLLSESGLTGKFRHPKLAGDRLSGLLERKLALGLEDWSATGLWVLARSDPDYPVRWKRLLGRSAPPLLFGAGRSGLLSPSRSLGAVGSRDCSEEGLAFARAVGQRAADSGFTLASGGARGVDREAMLAAYEAGGIVVGVLADSLRKEALSKRYREMILSGRLTLVSSFGPDARFTIGNAMGRNRLIYALCDAVVIADCEDSGGTWSGAVDNQKQWQIPMSVRTGANEGKGNAGVRSMGGRGLRLAELEQDWKTLFPLHVPRGAGGNEKQMELFAVNAQ